MDSQGALEVRRNKERIGWNFIQFGQFVLCLIYYVCLFDLLHVCELLYVSSMLSGS